MYSLEQLRGFVAVAEERHFGRAAERLRMTQPPLSRAVQRLERELGATLLQRGPKGVALTPAGAAFLADARRILAAADAAGAAVRRVAAGMAGALVIGCTALSAASILPGILADADRLLPDVRVSLRELVTDDQLDRLAAGALDLGLVRPHPEMAGIASQAIHREPLVVALPSAHALSAGTGPLPATDLDGHDLIDYDRGGARYLANLSARALADARPHLRHRVTQVHTMLALVGAGRGFALVPASALVPARDDVVARPLAGDGVPHAEVRVAWSIHTANAAVRQARERLPSLIPLGH